VFCEIHKRQQGRRERSEAIRRVAANRADQVSCEQAVLLGIVFGLEVQFVRERDGAENLFVRREAREVACGGSVAARDRLVAVVHLLVKQAQHRVGEGSEDEAVPCCERDEDAGAANFGGEPDGGFHGGFEAGD
jgi:hypothetical protein